MKELGFFITGLLVGTVTAAAVVFALLGNTIRVEVQVPSEYNIGGIPSDFTIRGGVNLSPTPDGSPAPAPYQVPPGHPYPQLPGR